MSSVGIEPLCTLHVDAEMGFSGGEVQVFLLLEGLRSRGQRPVLVAPHGSKALATARERGIECVPVSMGSDLDLPAVLRLRAVIQRVRPALVHLHTGRATWLGGLAAKLAGVPAITTRRMDRAVKRNWRNRWIYGSLVRRAVAISGPVRELLLDAGIESSKLELIHSSIDPERLRPARSRESWRAELGASPEHVVALVLANLVHRKGIDVLLQAMARARVDKLQLWIAGDGEERGTLEALSRELGLAQRVRFLGRQGDSAGLLAACDFSCLPSRREGLGVAALESMASARAVLASRVGGLAEAVEHDACGLLVEPEDVTGLAEALERLSAERELRERLGRGGPRSLERCYLASQMVERYVDLYARVLAETRAP
jgi:glycosyltransferase involved in cell wall biosynthesis